MTGAALAGTGRVDLHRPRVFRLLLDQVGYVVVDLWRAKVTLIFTLAIPLVWLIVVGIVAGGGTVAGEATEVPVMQFATPTVAGMGVIFAAFPTVAISLSDARDRGMLRRVRGTPLPAWVYLAGRILGAGIFAVGSVLAMLVVGVVAYDVQLSSRTIVATLVTLVLGIACFAAMGTAVAALSPSTGFAQSASIAGAVVLTFISGLFTIGGQLPAWLSSTADVLPLKPFAEALQDQFNPFIAGAGWHPRALGILAAWGVVAALVAARSFRWEPRTAAPRLAASTARGDNARTPEVIVNRRPAALSLMLDQTGAAFRATLRNAGSVFFSFVMPVGLYALLMAMRGSEPGRTNGIPTATYLAASMVAWGVAVAAFMNLPEAVAIARDHQVLKRLRGTPLRPWHYLVGRTAAGLAVALAIAAAVLVVGWLFFGLVLSPVALSIGLVVLLLLTLTLTVCGFVLVALTPNAQAISSIGLVILLPLAFFSDIFIVGGPAWMGTVGSFFPLKHAQNALALALDPAGSSVSWLQLGVLVLWLVGAGVVALRLFRWTPGRARDL